MHEAALVEGVASSMDESMKNKPGKPVWVKD